MLNKNEIHIDPLFSKPYKHKGECHRNLTIGTGLNFYPHGSVLKKRKWLFHSSGSSFHTSECCNMKTVKFMELWLMICDVFYMSLKGRRENKHHEYRLIFRLIQFVHSQELGIIWYFILLRLTSMPPSLACKIPKLIGSFHIDLLFLARAQLCLDPVFFSWEVEWESLNFSVGH